MRFFVGIELADEVREAVQSVQDELKNEFSNVKWVESDQLYLTIKFLGNPHLRTIGRVKKILRNASAQVAPLKLSLTNVGCFPESETSAACGPARVIWVGVSDDNDMLGRFQSDCEREFEKIGIAREEKQFVPHIIVGRNHVSDTKQKLRKRIKQLSVKNLSQEANEASLVQSKLVKSGPQYKTLARAKFTATVL